MLLLTSIDVDFYLYVTGKHLYSYFGFAWQMYNIQDQPICGCILIPCRICSSCLIYGQIVNRFSAVLWGFRVLVAVGGIRRNSTRRRLARTFFGRRWRAPARKFNGNLGYQRPVTSPGLDPDAGGTLVQRRRRWTSVHPASGARSFGISAATARDRR